VTANVLALLLANLFVLVAGAGVLRLLGGWYRPAELPALLATSYVGGLAAVGVALQLLLVVGVPFTRWTFVLTCFALALTGVAARPAATARRFWPLPRGLALLAALLALGIVGLLAVDLWWQPLGQWDAWAQWTAKARSIVLFDGLDADVYASEPYRRWNPDYPTLLPAVEAADFLFMGEVDTRAIHFQSWLVLVAFLISLPELLLDRVRALLVWPIVLLVAVAPALHVQTASAIADVPVGVFFALAGLCAYRWLVDGDPFFLRLTALLSAGALATKVEGRIFVAALFVSLATVLLVWGERRRVLPALAAVGAAVAVAVVPWVAWTSANDVVGVFSTSVSDALGRPLLDQLQRIPEAAARLAREAVDPTSWLLAVPLAVAAAVLAWRSRVGRAGAVFAVAAAGLALIGLVFVYWTTPLDPGWHLERSARRVVVGPVLLLVALTPLLLAQALEGRGEADGAPAGRG
jgi:hypothetical protein